MEHYNKKRVIDAYTRRAQLENRSEFDRDFRNDIPRLCIRKFIRPYHHALDIGGGAGANAALMAEHCEQVTLVDLTPSMIDYARANTASKSNIAIVQADILALPFSSQSFHLTTSFGDPVSYVLEKRSLAFDELVRVTRVGGYILLGCNSKYGAIRRCLADGDFKTALSIYESGETECVMGPPSHLYTVKEVTDLLNQRGCEIIEKTSTITFVDSEKQIPEHEWHTLLQAEMQNNQSAEWLGGEHLIFIAQRKQGL